MKCYGGALYLLVGRKDSEASYRSTMFDLL